MKRYLDRYGFAVLAVDVWQILSLVPALYIVLASLYPYALVGGAWRLLFDLPLAALPRWEAFALSFLYRLSGSEVLVALLLPGLALAGGILLKRLLGRGGKPSRVTRFFLAAACGADLILRLFPFSLLPWYGWLGASAGFFVRGACLGLILADLFARKNP